jgi:hypothetical protein
MLILEVRHEDGSRMVFRVRDPGLSWADHKEKTVSKHLKYLYDAGYREARRTGSHDSNSAAWMNIVPGDIYRLIGKE